MELCTKYRSEGVVGIDIAGDEFHANSLHLFRDVFQEAKRRNIHRTCHASEVGPAVNVRIALEELEVERIGHGYHVVADVELYRQCVQQNIHFECCPLSSHFTNALKTLEHQDTHPIVMFARDRANFSINKDDPTVLQNTLGDEYEYLRKLGLNEAFIVAAASRLIITLNTVIVIKLISICFKCTEFECRSIQLSVQGGEARVDQSSSVCARIYRYKLKTKRKTNF